jgi:serine/threonine protein phosphatase PrpC
MKESLKNGRSPVVVEWNQGGREYQEDYYAVFSKDNRTLLVAADGMGGHSRGDLASRWFVQALLDIFKQKKEVEEIFQQAITRTMAKIAQSGKDMGCTFTAAVIEKEGERRKLSYTWIGDSRLYLAGGPDKPSDNAKKIHQAGETNLWLLTDDDSFVWGFYLNNELTIDQITQHPNKNQLEISLHPRQQNAADIAIKRIRRLYLEENDRLFLCTDGVWEAYETQGDLLEQMTDQDPGNALRHHLEIALQNDLLKDNATFILAETTGAIFRQQLLLPTQPQRTGGLKRKINSFYAALLALLLFVLIFLTAIGKIGNLFEKLTGGPGKTDKTAHTNNTGKTANQAKTGDPGKIPKTGAAINTPPKVGNIPKEGEGIKKEKAKEEAVGKVTPREHQPYYSIRVGVFREKANADKEGDRYRQMNYPVRIIPPGQYHGKNYYVVLVGQFVDKSTALKEKKKLETAAQKKFYIEDIE